MDVLLRPVVDDDLPLIFGWHSDPASVAMAGVPARDRAGFDAHWTKIRADPTTELRTIAVDGEPVGYLLCFPRNGHQELGYWIAQEHWGKGIASAAVAAFLDEYPTRPLGAIVLASNTASLRVLLRCGFVELDRHDDEVVLQLT